MDGALSPMKKCVLNMSGKEKKALVTASTSTNAKIVGKNGLLTLAVEEKQ